MKQMSLTTVAIAASTFACATLLSFSWSEQRGVSLSVENAQARVGRPLTPGSAAGVARRHNRRAAAYYGGPNNRGGLVGGDDAGTYGGAAAVGTAAAVAATSPNWGWGGNPYRTGTGYYAVGPYYGGPVRGTTAAYYGGYAGVPASPGGWTGGVSSSDRQMYLKNLHDSGYNTKNNFNASGNVAQQ
jgi:hypothetical protein